MVPDFPAVLVAIVVHALTLVQCDLDGQARFLHVNNLKTTPRFFCKSYWLGTITIAGNVSLRQCSTDVSTVFPSWSIRVDT